MAPFIFSSSDKREKRRQKFSLSVFGLFRFNGLFHRYFQAFDITHEVQLQILIILLYFFVPLKYYYLLFVLKTKTKKTVPLG